jgi:hypothetical protein
MGQVYLCWWWICREINIYFSRFQYHMFYVLYPFLPYLVTLPRMSSLFAAGNAAGNWKRFVDSPVPGMWEQRTIFFLVKCTETSVLTLGCEVVVARFIAAWNTCWDCYRSSTTQLWNANMPALSNHNVSVHCCRGKHTVASSRTLLSVLLFAARVSWAKSCMSALWCGRCYLGLLCSPVWAVTNYEFPLFTSSRHFGRYTVR